MKPRTLFAGTLASSIAALLLARTALAAPDLSDPAARPPEPARQAPRPTEPNVRAPEPPSPAEHYGYQIVAVDLMAVGAGLAAHAASSPWRERTNEPPGLPAFIATSVYGLGAILPPTVHFAHRQVGMGFASLGMRIVVPPLVGVTGLVGVCVGRQGRSPCASDGVIGGMLVGEVIAAGIDAAVLAGDYPKTRGKPNTSWYGWQTLVVDAGVVGLSVYLTSRPRPPPEEGEERKPRHMLDAGIGWYALSWLGAPVVHFAHGRVGIGFADLGIRLVAPGVAAVPGIIGACAGMGGRKGCTDTGARAGLLGGVALAAAFDAFVLARESPPEPDDSSFFWAPTVQPQPGGATVGVVGAF